MPTCKHGNATPRNVDLGPLLLRHLTALLTQRSPPPETSLPDEFPAAITTTVSDNCHQKRYGHRHGGNGRSVRLSFAKKLEENAVVQEAASGLESVHTRSRLLSQQQQVLPPVVSTTTGGGGGGKTMCKILREMMCEILDLEIGETTYLGRQISPLLSSILAFTLKTFLTPFFAGVKEDNDESLELKQIEVAYTGDFVGLNLDN
nr:probable WRKY transcription factor 7 isoform X1 [Ipomoea batatas]